MTKNIVAAFLFLGIRCLKEFSSLLGGSFNTASVFAFLKIGILRAKDAMRQPMSIAQMTIFADRLIETGWDDEPGQVR